MNRLLQSFKSWVECNDQYFKEHGLQYEICESLESIDKESIRVDFDSLSSLSRITLWNTGECFLEVIDIDSEETLMSYYPSIDKDCMFDKTFRNFFKVINEHEQHNK